MASPLACSHFEVVPSCGAMHFPVIFESLQASCQLEGGDGSEKVELVIRNKAMIQVGGGVIPNIKSLRFRFAASFKLLASEPGAYTAALVVNGEAIKQATLHVHQIPSIRPD